MARGVTVTVVGTEDVKKKLRKFGVKAEDEQAAVIKDAGEIIRQAIADQAPVRSGALRDSIILEESKGNSSSGPFAVDIGPSKEPFFYAHFIEFGTARHTVRRKSHMLKHGPDDYAGRIEHPGTSARPFIRPAFDENIDRAIEEAATQFKKKLNL